MKPEEFPNRLKRLIAEHGLTQSQLAENTGIPASAISHFCRGARYPSFENLLRIMDSFGDPYSKAYLVGL